MKPAFPRGAVMDVTDEKCPLPDYSDAAIACDIKLLAHDGWLFCPVHDAVRPSEGQS